MNKKEIVEKNINSNYDIYTNDIDINEGNCDESN